MAFGIAGLDPAGVKLTWRDNSANESGFKRLFIDRENISVFYFRCINPKYKTNERVLRERVVRLARAIWVSRPPPKSP